MLHESSEKRQEAHPITGDHKIDRLALQVWQAIPHQLRQRDRDEVWRRCLGIACVLYRGPHEPSPETVSESAYRRGFVHGIVASTEALGRGATASELDEFMHERVMQWRYERHHGKLTPPPIWSREIEVAA